MDIHSWGQSAGAISVATQLIANDGDSEGLFRAAFMQSGSPLPVGDIEHGQKCDFKVFVRECAHLSLIDYDDLLNKTECAGAPDTLACLRTVPYESLKAAVDTSPFIFDYQVIVP